MIQHSDGTRRPPTKEEILEYVRKSSRTRSGRDAIDSQALRGSIENSDAEDRQYDIGSPDMAPGVQRQPENSGSPERSTRATNDRNTRENRPVGRRNGGIDEHIQGATTDVTTNGTATSYHKSPILKSKFVPYMQVIKDSFRKDKKANPRPGRKVLSDTEIKLKRDNLIRVLLIQSEHMDQAIQATTRGHREVTIWSTIDKKDAAVIADLMLQRAKIDPRMAEIVRQMVELELKMQAAIIITPRMYETVRTYIQRGFSIF